MPDMELMLERLERLAIVLDELMPGCAELVRDTIALLKEQEHKDKMFHALEEDWKRLKELLKEQEQRINELEEKLGTLTRWRANAGAFD